MDIQDKVKEGTISNSQKYVAASQFAKEEKYWQTKLFGEINSCSFPFDSSKIIINDRNIQEKEFFIPDGLMPKLMELRNNSDLRLFMILLSALNILLGKYLDLEDILIGTTIYKQQVEGDFINTILPIRNKIDGNLTCKELLLQVKNSLLEAVENQNFPIEILSDQLDVTCSSNSFSLFDTAVILENIHDKKYLHDMTPNMIFLFKRLEEQVFCTIEYNALLYKPQKIERIFSHYLNVLTHMLLNINIKISDIDILSPEEKDQLLLQFNPKEYNYDKSKLVHELFEDQVKKNPGNTAIFFEDKKITYLELNEKANQLAWKLRDKGVKKDSIIGVLVERSVEMIISILAVLKAGGAYMPLDKDYPNNRINFMVNDSEAKILLIQKEMLEKIDDNIKNKVDIIFIEDQDNYTGNTSNLIKINNQDSLAYVIYTSGTTGEPKGVMVEQGNLLAYVKAYQECFNMTSQDIVVMQASYVFDVFVEELYPSILNGGKVLILPLEKIIDIPVFADEMRKHKVTVINCSPLMLNELNKLPLVDSIRLYNCGGDIVKMEYISNLMKNNAKVHNSYGPTETTVCATSYRCNEEVGYSLPIGKPFVNYKAYIVNKANKPVPIGVPGELCIGGDGVSRGYLKQQDLTGEKFIEDPFANSGRIYKTGDSAKWLEDGNIDFLGRIDHQVKIRGYRIELGEIEYQLMNHEDIREAIVLLKEDKYKDKYLCAYIVKRHDTDSEKIREYLANKIPEYMIPSYFIFIDSIPLTGFGKINRKKLLSIDEQLMIDGSKYREPEDEIEEKLVSIWEELLGLEKVGTIDNFFAIGGHSLNATILMSRIEKSFNVKIPLVEIFQTPTIKYLAEYISQRAQAGKKESIENIVLIKKGEQDAKNLFLVHDGTGEVQGYIDFCNELKINYNCYGIRASKIEKYTPKNITINHVAEEYIKNIRKIQPKGPYYITGWSFGGIIAFEMTRQLEQVNEKVEFLGMIDSFALPEELKNKAINYSLEFEKKLLLSYKFDDALLEQINNETDIYEIWPNIINYFEKNNTGKDIILKYIPESLLLSIPNYSQLSVKELIYYMNLSRTLDNAWASYNINSKISTKINFIASSNSRKEYKDFWNIWNNYSELPVQYYEVRGDHFSIFKHPHVIELAKIFKLIFKK